MVRGDGDFRWLWSYLLPLWNDLCKATGTTFLHEVLHLAHPTFIHLLYLIVDVLDNNLELDVDNNTST